MGCMAYVLISYAYKFPFEILRYFASEPKKSNC